MANDSLPRATLGRIPLYIQYLKDLPDGAPLNVSAPVIARGLSLGEVQVRKDLAMISGSGKPRTGYQRYQLLEDLERRLGYHDFTGAVLVGAGKLGRALLDYDGFEEFGIKVLAGFDRNEKTIRISGGRHVFPIGEIESFIGENNVKLGIITVGQGSAQEVCNRLVAAGVRAIWNFAPCALSVPDGVLLKQENLALSLAHLNSQTKIEK